MHNRKQDLLPLIVILLVTSTAFLDDNVTEETTSLQDLPATGANTVQSELGSKQADEVEKISYEDIVTLHDVEWHESGEEYEGLRLSQRRPGHSPFSRRRARRHSHGQ
jgi:hypothetical protein